LQIRYSDILDDSPVRAKSLYRQIPDHIAYVGSRCCRLFSRRFSIAASIEQRLRRSLALIFVDKDERVLLKELADLRYPLKGSISDILDARYTLPSRSQNSLLSQAFNASGAQPRRYL